MSAGPERANAETAGRGLRIGPDLWPRIAAAVVLGPAALAAAYVGGIVFAAFWAIAAVVVLWEWQRMVAADRLFARVALGALAIAVVALSAMNGRPYAAVAALAVGAAAVAFVAGERRGWAGAGALYAGAPVASLVLLRASPIYGLAAIFWLFAVVWGADVAAYFAGRSIGGPKLWPRVSPGKTWSGALAGALAGAAIGLVICLLMVPGPLRVDLLFGLGVAAAVVSVFGDLFESALKRRFGLKDSSRLIPGHGGLMDRLDSFIAASTFAALVAAANSRGSFLASGLFQW